jgi:hypothetical protein
MNACENVNLQGHASKVNKHTVVLDFEEMQDANGRAFKVGQHVKKPNGTHGKIHRFRQSGHTFGADIKVTIGDNKFLYFENLDNLLTI